MRPAFFVLLLWIAAWSSSAAQDAADWTRKMEAAGLVDIQSLDPDIVVDLMYSREDNFMKKDVYGDLERAYFVPSFADRLVRANKLLKSEKGDRYTLIIYDGARPLSVQRRMWEQVKGTPGRKYVASPGGRNGRHNYGLAADLSIFDTMTGRPLDMGSPVDHFGVEAHIGNEASLVKAGKITPEARANRAYLHDLMKRVGLRPIAREWWHLQEFTSLRAVKRHKILDF